MSMMEIHAASASRKSAFVSTDSFANQLTTWRSRFRGNKRRRL